MACSQAQWIYLAPHQSLLKVVAQLITQASYSHLILPHERSVSWLKSYVATTKSIKPCILPKITTLEMPLGSNCLLKHQPLPFAKGIGLMTQLLKKYGYEERSLKHLVTLSSSLLDLWESVSLYDGKWQVLDKLIPERLSQHSQKTLEILKIVGRIWPSFVQQQGFCSRSEAQREALEVLRKYWHQTPPDKALIAGIDPSNSYGLALINAIEDIPSCQFLFPWNLKTYAAGSLKKMLVPCEPEFFISTPTSFNLQEPIQEASSHLRSIACSNLLEQARVIAVLIREALEDSKSVTALVRPCPALIPYLQQELKRWGIHLPVCERLPVMASFLSLILKGSLGKWSLSSLLTLARHPLMLKAHPIGLLMASQAEKLGLDLSSSNYPQWANRGIERVNKATLLLMQDKKASLAWWIKTHLKAAQCLVPWALRENPQLTGTLWKWCQAELPHLSGKDYADLLPIILSELPSYEIFSPQLVICKPQDLPLLSPSRCIFTTLTLEDSFPWLPSSFKEGLSLPTYSRTLCAPSSSENFLVSLDEEMNSSLIKPNLPVFQWVKQLDPLGISPFPSNHSKSSGSALLQQYPRPPLSRISISDLYLWRTDIEAFYKQCILRVRPFQLSYPQLWGVAIHTLMDQFIRTCPPDKDYSQSALLSEIQLLASYLLPPMDFIKKHLLNNLLEQVVRCEWMKRQKYKFTSSTEVRGHFRFVFQEDLGLDQYQSTSPTRIELIARADRIDYLDDGTAHVIDYKTGSLPAFIDIDRMDSLQLPLEALMIEGIKEEWGKNWTALETSNNKIHPLKKNLKWKIETQGFPRTSKVSQLSWWNLTLNKGCIVKTYSRPLPSLLASYRQALPLWLYTLCQGQY